MNKGKSFWKSKTFWLNVIGIGAMLVQSSTGFIIDPEYQASILAVINLVLRGITKGPIDWSKTGSVLPIIMLLALMTSTASMQGCAVATALIDDHTLVAELAVRAATGRVLEEHPNWTEKAYHITGDAIQMLNSDDTTSLEGLQQFIVDKIPWQSLTTEEQALITTLITAVRMQVEKDMTDRGVVEPGEVKVRAAMVLTWINQTAKLRMPKVSERGGKPFVACSLCTDKGSSLQVVAQQRECSQYLDAIESQIDKQLAAQRTLQRDQIRALFAGNKDKSASLANQLDQVSEQIDTLLAQAMNCWLCPDKGATPNLAGFGWKVDRAIAEAAGD